MKNTENITELVTQLLTLTEQDAISWQDSGEWGDDSFTERYEIVIDTQHIDITRFCGLFFYSYQLRFVGPPAGTFSVTTSKRLLQPLFDSIFKYMHRRETRNQNHHIGIVLEDLNHKRKRKNNESRTDIDYSPIK